MSSQPQLNGPIHAEPVDEQDEVSQLREELSDLRAEFEDFKSNYEQERSQLGAMLHGLRAVLNGAVEAPASYASPSASGPLDPSRYAPWKQKFPGQTAAAIDILVKYESGLTRKQLASFLKVEPGSGTMSQIIFKLNKAELITKDGNVIRLKRL